MLMNSLEKAVFSTYVEVIPLNTVTKAWNMSILHVCGGDPKAGLDFDSETTYSPRMWR